MNIFNKLIDSQNQDDIKLGVPSNSPEQLARRLTFFSMIRDGKGFRQNKKPIKTDAQRKTRGQRHKELQLQIKASKELREQTPIEYLYA